MKQYGYIKLSRKSFDRAEGDPFWKESRVFSRYEAWIDLIQMASWKSSTYRTAGRADSLRRGEFVASLRYLAERWKWTKSRVERFIELLQKQERIAPAARQGVPVASDDATTGYGNDSAPSGTPAGQATGHLSGHLSGQHGTVYLIVKYDTYQSANSVSGTPTETPNGTPTETPGGPELAKDRDKVESSKAINTLGAYPPEFELLWAQYPKRAPNNPKGPAFKAYSARLREKISYQAMFDGTQRYAAFATSSGIVGTRFVKMASTFYGPERWFAESWEGEPAKASADPLGSTSSVLKDSWLVKNGYASESAA